MDQSNPSSSTVTWQVAHIAAHLHTDTSHFQYLPTKSHQHCNWFLSSSLFLSRPLSYRGQDVDGDPAQQHRADPGAFVPWEEPTFSTLWLRRRRGAVSSHRQPIRALWAGTVLPLQEVPPPQHTRSSHLIYSLLCLFVHSGAHQMVSFPELESHSSHLITLRLNV